MSKTSILEKLTGIELSLDRLKKSQETQPQEEEEKVNEEETPTLEEVELPEVKLSLEDLPLVEDEPEEEQPEQQEEVQEVDFDELVGNVTEAVMQNIQGKLSELEQTVERIVSSLARQTDAIEGIYQGDDHIEKSLQSINQRLDKLTTRKSVANIHVMDRFEEKEPITLTKSQRAAILVQALQAGNRNVRVEDVTNCELGKPISPAAQEVIAHSVK